MRAIIIDDDIVFKKVLKDYLEDTDILDMEVSINNDDLEYDVYFLDIDMPEIDGISYAKKIKSKNRNSYIIFVSNRNDLVFDAMKVFPFSFVRKQNLETDLPLVLNELKSITGLHDYLIIDEIKVKLCNIIYIEKVGSYSYVHTKENIYKVRKTLEYFFDLINSRSFIYVNKGTIVNVQFVKNLSKEYVILQNDKVVYISRGRKKEVLLAYYRFKEE